MGEGSARAINLDRLMVSIREPSGSVVASLEQLGIEATGINDDDAKAALERLFVSFIKDPANAEVVKEFFDKHGETSPIPQMDPEKAARAAAEAKQAESTFETLTAETFDDWVQNKTVLIDFTADWCGPCKMLAPVLRGVAEEFNLPVGRIDADVSKDLVERFSINGYPTVLLIRDGVELNRVVGAGTDRHALAEILRVAFKQWAVSLLKVDP